MITERLAQIARSPHAMKIFWETIDPRLHTVMVEQLYHRKEFIDKNTKIHRFDEHLARRLSFRPASLKTRPLDWRIERLLHLAQGSNGIIHDICHGYLKAHSTQLIEDLRLLGNDGQPDLSSNQYPKEWYLRVVEHLQAAAPPPLAAMCMFTLFSECPGRAEAFEDDRYEAIWAAHLAWSAAQKTADTAELPAAPDVNPDPVVLPPARTPDQTPAAKPTKPRREIPLPPKLPEPPTKLGSQPTHFSPFDRLLQHAIHDCVAGVVGALTSDDMAAALRELLSLNGDNVTYHYHAGYYAALSGARFSPSKNQSQEAQAWAFLGYILGAHRSNSEYAVESIQANQKLWDKVLVTLPSADVTLLYVLVPAFDSRGEYDALARLLQHCPLPQMAAAAHPDSIPHAVYTVAARLVRNGEHQTYADSILQALIHNCGVSQLHGDFYARCLRKRGQLLRRKKQYSSAIDMFHAAREVSGFTEVAQCHADIGLSAAGFPSLDSIVPAEQHDFRVIASALKSQQAYFEEALTMPYGEYTNAQFVLGLIALADGLYEQAFVLFTDAKSGMERQLEAYQNRGLYDWAVFLRVRTWSQHIELGDIPSLSEDLQQVFTSQIFFPLKHWLAIYRNIARVDRQAAHSVMLHLFSYRDVDIYDLCQINEVMEQPRDIWERYFFGRRFVTLPRAEKFEHYVRAWHYAIDGGVAATIEYVLNLLEYHGETYSEHAAQIDQLIVAAYDTVLRVWGEVETLQTRIQLLFLAGKPDDAVTLIEQLLNIYLGQQAFAQARATLGLLATFPNSNAGAYHDLLVRPHVVHKPRPCKVLYIGGNETQQSFKDQINEKLRTTHPHIAITWELIGWRSNWDRDAERIERVIPQYDLVILSPYVRTLFGRYIRRVADNWRPSTGKGQGKIYADIVAAVESFQLHEGA
ncbi:MAG: hypothetical protein RLZZ297_1213 [Chloroflexota bacterium]